MTTFKANRKFPNPITVTDDTRSHTLALQQIIEALNVGQRRTREINSSYVRVSELVDMGLIEIVGNQLKLTNLGQTIASGSTTLAALTDVDLTGLADGDTLIYNSATLKWEPGAGGGGGGLTDLYDQTLNNLADVGFYMPNHGDVLTYNASSGLWEAEPTNTQATLDVQVFTSSGTWVKPAGAISVSAYVLGAGGGGGSGRVAASGTRMGGGGGGGGGLSYGTVAASVCATTEIVTVGAGGAGGAGQTVDTTDGNSGTAGGDSSFGTHVTATGGGAGTDGTSSSATGNGGAGGTGTLSNGGAGGKASGAGGQTAGSDATWGGGGGSGGCGISSGGTIGDDSLIAGIGGTSSMFPAAGGAAISNTPATNGFPGADSAGYFGGGGGSAGTASGSANGGVGGAGGRGGGGGGGSAAINGFDGGSGGAGGGGMVVVITQVVGTIFNDEFDIGAVRVQASDLVITSNNVFQDTDLVIRLEPGVYSFSAYYEINSHATPQMQVQVTFTGTSTVFGMLHLFSRTTTFGNEHYTATPAVVTYGVAGRGGSQQHGTINVSVAGDLKVQARQITSSATPVTFYSTANLIVRRIA